MSTILYYPTKAAPSATLTLPDPRPDGVVAAPLFYTGLQVTDGGTEYAYEHAGPFKLFDLEFLIRSKTTFDALLTFINTSVRGTLYTFEADVLGVEYTGCRFRLADWSDALRTRYQCTGQLEIYTARLAFRSS